ncbi:histidine kinase [Dorea sp. YH-dor226]|uniref:sensor histidine kinase n=1 Tax=Dorea sp. YH-dor226 TaxID=3151119 RepID=UPI003241BC80
MTEQKKSSGIQRKYLKYMISLLILALFLSSIGVWFYMRKNMTSVIVDKYEFMNEKMGMAMDNLYQKSDEVTADCIVNDNVQKSLKTKGLEEVEKNALSKYFAYIDLDHVAEYCYVDNKENVYTKSYSKISYEDFEKSGFADELGEEYSRTKWFWAKDELFGDGEYALFIGRYVRSMDYAHDPGMLFLKMNDEFLSEVVTENDKLTDEVAVGIVDTDGRICMEWSPDGFEMEKTDKERIRELAGSDASSVIVNGEHVKGGILSVYRQEKNGMLIYTLVPNKVLNQGMNQILMVLIGIYLLVMAAAFVISIYASRVFTRPIKKISDAMTEFDGQDFTRTVDIHTNTELDNIGESYNKMLENIEQLLLEIKSQEKELRTSELNMLISQINPHFLYNTLDTIYMLARINGEETTMKMIQALSRYLRLSLSKGRDMVTVEDELENVKSYMEIQQIRNENLFRYEIDCQVDAKNRWVLKLVLQPLVENAIKYGFCDIYEGGLIRIRVKEVDGKLILAVYNNGTPMEAETAEKINALGTLPVTEMKECFPDKQHGYGVVNIITRLRLKYGEDVGFAYEVQKEGTECVIQLPVDGTENDEL